MPSGTGEARHGRIVRRGWRDPPPGRGGGGEQGQLLLGDRPPAAQDESQDPGFLRGQLKAAGGSEAQMRDLAHHGREPALLQPLLHDRQDLPVAEGLGVDDPVRVEASAGEAGGEEIPPGQAPEHGAPEAGEDPGREQGRGPGEFRRRPALDDLVQAAERQAVGQVTIQGSDAEGDAGPEPVSSLKALNLPAQIGQHHPSPGMQHALPRPP